MFEILKFNRMLKHAVKFLGLYFCYVSAFAQHGSDIDLKRLDIPSLPAGISWGVPFENGKVRQNQDFILEDANGRTHSLQYWPLAYWPDGSLKWVGFATVTDSAAQDNFTLKLSKNPGKKKSEENSLAKDELNSIHINTGSLKCIIHKQGPYFLDSVFIQNRLVAIQGRLVGILQDHPDDDYLNPANRASFQSQIEQVQLEQNGSIRSVVHVKGKHVVGASSRAWLPFDIRLYFYKNTDQINMVYTMVFDGDDRKDFIKALGTSFDIPMNEEIQNRHVRFGGEGKGLWDEPVKPLVGRRRITIDDRPVYSDQVQGKRVPDLENYSPRVQELIGHLAAWNDYRLVQNQADGFTIQKRTNDKSTWIDAIGGKRASGLAFVGDVSGGMAVGVKDFWQSYPSGLEIANATTDMSSLTVWFWPPQAEAMDLRHYDTLAYGHDLTASYEDVQPGFSTAHGVARTSEIKLFFWNHVPSNQELSATTFVYQNRPLLLASPAHLHRVGVFGKWSLPDTSSPGKKYIEQQLNNAIEIYKIEIEQRRWYGFWDYGDVMHTYDPVRHSWRYDVGGFAWANTELVPDMWLWYSFLRTGRSDIFKMAEAMTRHTSEVDVYHTGKFEGLGSRHNVSHWGCGAKEVRISQAALKRFFYYLTTDERTGDLMMEVAEKSELAMTKVDPLRLILKDSLYPTHIRIGPDWLALVGNWMTTWERTGDTQWRDKMEAGVESFADMPYGFFSGKNGAFGFTPEDQRIHVLQDDDIGYSHLTTLMGGAEVAFELSSFWDNKEWNRLWLNYCTLYGAPVEEVEKSFGKHVKLGNGTRDFAKLPAYAAYINNDPKMAKRAWHQFLDTKFQSEMFGPVAVDTLKTVSPIKEVPYISTNSTAQWCLNAIALLELIGDYIPQDHERWNHQ